MNASRFVVTTTVEGRKRSQVWNASEPMRLGYEGRWMLEKDGSAFRARQVGGTSVVSIAGRDPVSLPDLKMQVRVVPASTLSPPYRHPEGELPPSKELPQLLAFSGVGSAILRSQPIHGAYVAFVRTQPVFTLYKDGDKGFQIKPLLDGVKFKLKGQKAISGPIGETWNVRPDQLYGASVIRGSHWWRFNLVQTATPAGELLDDEAQRIAEGGSIKKMVLILALVIAAVTAAVWLAPSQPKPVEEPKEIPVVKFIAPKPRPQAPKAPEPAPVPAAPVAAAQPVAAPAAPAAPVEAPKKVEPKADRPPKHEAKKEAPKKAEPKVAPPAPSKPAVDPAVAAAKAAAEKRAAAQKAANAKLSLLRAALSGASAMTASAPSAASRAKTDGAAQPASAFLSDGPAVGKTEVKPTGYSEKGTSVAAVGGSYAKGEHAAAGAAGASSSFVSMDAGGPSVEEGLSKDEVGAVIHKHLDEIRYCHESAMLYHPNLQGKLVAQFTIDGRGTVRKPAVQNTTLPDQMLETCILQKLVTWKFPKPKGGVNVQVSYPFIFKTLEQD